MDWIKVKTTHALYEYNDLRDSEFMAWIKIMALTATLEHEPTRKQILRHVNYQTLDSLSKKLHNHSIDISSIIHKVLIDVSSVSHKRDVWKKNKREYREHKQGVLQDFLETSDDKIREEKIREDIKDKEPFRLPEKEEIENGSKPLVLKNIELAANELYEKNIWPKVHTYKNAMLKRGCNERAVLTTLTRCLIKLPDDPWGYCVTIMKTEDGNFNARDYEKNCG